MTTAAAGRTPTLAARERVRVRRQGHDPRHVVTLGRLEIERERKASAPPFGAVTRPAGRDAQVIRRQGNVAEAISRENELLADAVEEEERTRPRGHFAGRAIVGEYPIAVHVPAVGRLARDDAGEREGELFGESLRETGVVAGDGVAGDALGGRRGGGATFGRLGAAAAVTCVHLAPAGGPDQEGSNAIRR